MALIVGRRGAAWCAVAGGLAAGLASPPPQAHEPPRHGAYVVLAADFHVHSFPGDGSLAPWDLAPEAQRRGLDAVALTNHNQRLSWRLAQLLPWHPAGAMLIPGEELTSAGYHLAAVGVTEAVAWRQPAASAAAEIRMRGGVAIAAHPAGDEAKGLDAAAIDVLDGVEAAHPVMFVFDDARRDIAAFYARAKARRPSIAAIGSTDFHFFAPVGLCRTYLFATERSVAGILDAIRRGATVACDAAGQTYGPDDLSAVVAEPCRCAATAPPEGDTWADALGTLAVWMGLTALVVLGADEGTLDG